MSSPDVNNEIAYAQKDVSAGFRLVVVNMTGTSKAEWLAQVGR